MNGPFCVTFKWLIEQQRQQRVFIACDEGIHYAEYKLAYPSKCDEQAIAVQGISVGLRIMTAITAES